MKNIKSEIVQLNDIVPFEWDTVYTFPPYQRKESIEETIGFKSDDILANNINEGMVHLIFTKDEVILSVLEYPDSLGYYINLPPEVSFEENAKFSVEENKEITILTYIE